MKTSATDPLRVDFLPRPALPARGRLGMTIAPGKKDSARAWNRDLDADLARLRRSYRASVLVSLMEQHEYELLDIRQLRERAEARGLAVTWWPIKDVSTPDERRMKAFSEMVRAVHGAVEEGATVVVHCRGGLGRSGLVAACVLVEAGVPAGEAIRVTRAARPGAIETTEQEAWIRAYADARGQDPSSGPRASDSSRERFVGCLLGGAVGDALGAPVEFMTMGEIRARFGSRGITELSPAYGRTGAITDDTQMTMFTAEGLVRAQIRSASKGICCAEAVVFNAYKRWLWTQESAPADEDLLDGWLCRVPALRSRRAPGNTCLAAAASRDMGTPEEPINDSKGCGGIMRVAPAGLVGSDAFDLGARIAATTHGHPSGYLAAGYFAEAIAHLAAGSDLPAAFRAARNRLEDYPRAEEVLAAVDQAHALAESDAPSEPEVLERLGGGWVAEESLAIAIFCALRAESFEHGVRLAVNHGGDSDSTGSLVGNLLGLHLGLDAIPARWLETLELRAEIERLACDLHDVSGVPSWADDAGDAGRWWADHPSLKDYPGC